MINVMIREVGLRDGLQMLPTVMTTADKLDWIFSEFACGVREFEASSFVSAKHVPQLSDAAEVCAHAVKMSGLTVSALAPNLRGAEFGIAAGVDKINFVISVSEEHNQANVRRSVEQSVSEFARVAELLKATKGHRPRLVAGLATSFGCTISGRVLEGDVRKLAISLVKLGADELIIADTVGYADPASIRSVFTSLRADLGNAIPIAAHLHDTRGLGLANALAALEGGVRAFDSSLGGLGGCPNSPGATGNVPTEDLVFMCESMGLRTGIDLPRLLQVRSKLKHQLPDAPFAGSIARAGLPKGWDRASH